MSTPGRLLDLLQALGVTVAIEGDKLRITPASKLTPDMLEELKVNKPIIMQVLVASCHCDPLPRWNEPGGAAGCNPLKHTRCPVCGYVWQCKVCGGCRRCRTPG